MPDSEDYWARESIAEFTELGYLEGYEDGTLRPSGQMTRAEFMKLLVLAAGLTDDSADLSVYTDVAKDAWYYKYVALAVTAGAVLGKSETTMEPNSTITRQEAITMIARLAGLDSADNAAVTALCKAFTDADDIDGWAVKSAAGMYAAGHLKGYEDGTVRPRANLTRAEGVELLYRVLDLLQTDDGTEFFTGKITAEFISAEKIVLDGLPEDAENVSAMVCSVSDDEEYTYLTPLVYVKETNEISVAWVQVVDDAITINADLVTVAGTSETYGMPVAGTEYTICLLSDNYLFNPFTTVYTIPMMTEEQSTSLAALIKQAEGLLGEEYDRNEATNGELALEYCIEKAQETLEDKETTKAEAASMIEQITVQIIVVQGERAASEEAIARLQSKIDEAAVLLENYDAATASDPLKILKGSYDYSVALLEQELPSASDVQAAFEDLATALNQIPD